MHGDTDAGDRSRPRRLLDAAVPPARRRALADRVRTAVADFGVTLALVALAVGAVLVTALALGLFLKRAGGVLGVVVGWVVALSIGVTFPVVGLRVATYLYGRAGR